MQESWALPVTHMLHSMRHHSGASSTPGHLLAASARQCRSAGTFLALTTVTGVSPAAFTTFLQCGTVQLWELYLCCSVGFYSFAFICVFSLHTRPLLLRPRRPFGPRSQTSIFDLINQKMNIQRAKNWFRVARYDSADNSCTIFFSG